MEGYKLACKVIILSSAFLAIFCDAQDSSADTPFIVTCMPDSMTVSVPRSFYHEDVHLEDLHLNDFSCRGDSTADSNWIFSTGTLSSCSTVFTKNSTHITYSNILSNVVESQRVYTGTVYYTLFSCSYEINVFNLMLSLPHSSLRYGVAKNNANFTVPSMPSKFSASMNLYSDQTYSTLETSHVYRTTDTLYVLIELQTNETTLNVVIDSCWVTPTAEITYVHQYNFIEDGCAVTDGIRDHVTITRSGDGRQAHFQTQVFAFIDYDTTFLHCSVEICSSSAGESCVPTCPRRPQRDVSGLIEDSFQTNRRAIVSVGPLRHEKDQSQSDLSANVTSFPYMSVMIAVIATLVIAVAILVLLMARQRRASRRNAQRYRLGVVPTLLPEAGNN